MNIPQAADASNKIGYLSIAGTGVSLWNELYFPATKGYTPVTRWYLKNAITGTFDFQGMGNHLNYLPLSAGKHTMVASTSWYLPGNNNFTMSVDSIQVDVNDGSNHLLLETRSSNLFGGPSKEIKVTLLKQDANTQLFSPVNSTTGTTQSSCNCVSRVSFHEIPAGTYIVRATLAGATTGTDPYEVPTYTDSAASWQQATPLLYGSGTAFYKGIEMVSTKALIGKGFISGTIYENNFTGVPLSGIQVLLRNKEGILQKEAVTDASGGYAFSNLPDGTYEVYPEELNFRVQRPASLFLGEELDALTASRNFVRDAPAHLYKPDVPTGVGAVQISGFSIAPNPASNLITIRLEKAVGKVEVILSNVSGQAVLQEEFNGTSHSLPIGGLPAGFYLLQLQNGGSIYKQKVQIQH